MKPLVRVEMAEVGPRPNGMALQRFSGRIGPHLCRFTLTSSELHMAFSELDGPAFAVSLRGLGEAMTETARTLILGERE